MATGKVEDRSNHVEPQQADASRKGRRKLPAYSSNQLFADFTEITIDHNGVMYTLRITRGGGLILNK